MSGGLGGCWSVSAWPAPKGGRVLGVGILRFVAAGLLARFVQQCLTDGV